MDIQKRFLRGLLFLTAVALVLFSLEFVVEWLRQGKPDAAELSYANQYPNVKNTKLVDVLSPTARAYNNILAMLLAAVGLAIPLTANMHTPKLIEMFLRDRVNRIMLGFGALGAAHVLWVAYLVGPDFAPTWAYRLAVLGAVLGWVFLIPYFFYVIRFLDPSNILKRIKAEVLDAINSASTNVGAAHERVRDGLHQLGTITIKSIDRADRGVAAEGIWCFKQLLDHYRKQKGQLPPEWFKVDRHDLVGLSPEALEILNTEGTWLEHAALWQMYLVYMNALTKAPDTLSALSDAVRVIGTHAAADNDERVLELAVRIFNNFLRETIKKKDMHAIYDLLYQYRRLALELVDRPVLLGRLGGYLRYYGELAVSTGLEFVPQILVFDVAAVVSRAFEVNSPAAAVLLREFLALRQRGASGLLPMVIKGKAVLGARLLEAGHAAAAGEVRAALQDVPREALQRAEQELLNLEDRLFWEVTDRQVNLEWVAPERRDGLRRFFAQLVG